MPIPFCPKCDYACISRKIKDVIVFDCSGCKDQIAQESVIWK